MNRAAALDKEVALPAHGLSKAQQVAKPDNIFRFEIRSRHSDKISRAPHVFFRQIDKAPYFTALGAARLARELKSFRHVPPLAGRAKRCLV